MKISFDYDGTLDHEGPIKDLFNLLCWAQMAWEYDIMDIYILTDMTEKEAFEQENFEYYYHTLCSPSKVIYTPAEGLNKLQIIEREKIDLHFDDNDVLAHLSTASGNPRIALVNYLKREE